MPLRILIVDDFEPWRRFVSSALQEVDSQILFEVSDGLEAVYKAEELRPDLILLDIGLPTLNGIKAARRIRDRSPDSKILFLSEENSPEVAEAALEAGGAGYLVKSDAGRELLPAVKALSKGRRYLGARLAGQAFFAAPENLSDYFANPLKTILPRSKASTIFRSIPTMNICWRVSPVLSPVV